MPDDYSFKMTDLEYKKFTLRNTIDSVKEQALSKYTNAQKGLNGANDVPDDCNVSELVDSDSDINAGDDEDNADSSDELDDVESLSLSGDHSKSPLEEEFNLNVSFSGGYIPNTDLTRVDKGQGNPQFSGLEIRV